MPPRAPPRAPSSPRTNKTIAGGKSLNLNKETVLHLSASLLKDVKGGYPPDTDATHCESRCRC